MDNLVNQENSEVTTEEKVVKKGKKDKKEGKALTKIVVSIVMAVALLLSFCLGFVAGNCSQNTVMQKLNEIMAIAEKVSKNPNGENEIDIDFVAKTFISSICQYDSYAYYYTPSEYQALLQEDEGKYQGIGVSCYRQNCVLTTIYGNSPAEKVGIKKYDKVLYGIYNGVKTSFSTTSDMIKFMSNIEKKVDFILGIDRDGVELEFTICKDDFVSSYVTYYDSETKLSFSYEEGKLAKNENNSEKMADLNDDTAYISFILFEGNAVEEFKTALDFMKERGRTKLILDLRDNGGGLVNIMREIASFFVENNGKGNAPLMVVQTKNGEYTENTTTNNFYSNIKGLTVLANDFSASASECLLGVFLYYKPCGFNLDNLILTEYNESRQNYSTYGKGIMQSTYVLATGGAIRLTVAKLYFMDRETCIHGTGVVQTNANNCVSNSQAIKRAVEILG